jgi:hypothetical protein
MGTHCGHSLLLDNRQMLISLVAFGQNAKTIQAGLAGCLGNRLHAVKNGGTPYSAV